MEPGCPAGGVHSPEDPPTARRFESWKEIAAYFGRDARTLRRWERTEGLPVHRHHHRSRGSVYAFQEELDRWLTGRRDSTPINTPTPRPPWAKMLLLAGLSAALGLTAWALLAADRAELRREAPAPPPSAAADTAGRAARWLADFDARERFLVASHRLQRRSGYREQARIDLEATIARAPEFPEAHALLGEAYLRQALYGPGDRAEAWRRAEAAVRRALALDERLATAHAVLSRILLLRDWNVAAAAAESLRAIALDPTAAEARSAYALCLRARGRLADAIAERARAQRADPLNPQWLVFLGDEYTFARRYEEARRTYHRALAVDADYRNAIASLGEVYARLDRHAEAAEWQHRWLIARGENDTAAAFDDVRRREGPRAAMVWLDRWNVGQLERAADRHPWDLAYLHARLGNRETALAFLERALEQRDSGMLQARVDPDLDSLRLDPRFTALLQRVVAR